MSESKSAARRRKKKERERMADADVSKETEPQSKAVEEAVKALDRTVDSSADTAAERKQEESESTGTGATTSTIPEQELKKESKSAQRRRKQRERSQQDKGAPGDSVKPISSEESPVNSAETSSVDAAPETPKTADTKTEKPAKAKEGAKKKDKAPEKKGKGKGKKAKKQPARKKQKALFKHLERIREEERRRKEEEERVKREEEEEKKRIEEERLRIEREKKEKREKKKKKKIELREQGLYISKAEKMKQKKAQNQLQMLIESGVVEHSSLQTVSSSKDEYKRKKEEKRRKRKEEEEKRKLQEEQRKLEEENKNEENEETLEEEEDDILDNWEDELSDEDVELEKDSNEEEEEERADSSDEKEVTIEEEPDLDKESSEISEFVGAPRKSRISGKELRSPISAILGHVDTGKTKLLDKIRKTNVQDGEAGGITQQIGASFFPLETLEQKTRVLLDKFKLEYKVPGLLVIDTPGHEAFSNLRSRGTNLCDIAILVIDIMHGIENQTRESIEILKMTKTPFVVALNKIDRLNDWKAIPDANAEKTLGSQAKHTIMDFEDRLTRVKGELGDLGFNSDLYYENKNIRKTVSLVPTSAITGEGIPDMLCLLLQITQNLIEDQLNFLSDNLEATVLEVKAVEGLGTTIDVILANGTLREGDRIVLCGMNGPIVTSIRALLTPQPLKELRVKADYIHHKQIKAAMGVKISAPNLEETIAGSSLLVAKTEDEVEDLSIEVMSDMENLFSRAESMHGGKGCHVQASTLGSLEALMGFLKQEEVPIASVGLGPVTRKDVVKSSVMMESKMEYATILAFDVKIERDAVNHAEELGVKVITADIIYHLVTDFKAYEKEISERRKADLASEVVFPAIFKILPGHTFNTSNPIIVGCEILEGTLRVGTPIFCHDKGVTLGKVTSLENNHKQVTKAEKGTQLAVKIEPRSWEPHYMVGRHVMENDIIMSKITRESLDTLKTSFKDEITREDIIVIQKLKKLFGIA